MENNNFNENVIVEEVSQNQNVENISMDDGGEKKKKKLIIPIVIILLLVLIGVGLFIYFKSVTNKNKIVDNIISKTFNEIREIEEESKDLEFDYKNKAIDYNLAAKFDLEYDINNNKAKYEDIKFTLDTIVDIKDKKLSLSFDAKEKSNEILSLDAYLKSNVLNFKSNLFENQYKLDVTELGDIFEEVKLDELSSVNYENMLVLTNKMEKFVKKAILEEYITQENGKFKVDSKELKGLKTTLTLTDERKKDINLSIYESIKNDSEFLNVLSSILSEDKDELVDALKEKIEDLKENDYYSEGTTYISIYTTKFGKFEAFELKDENENSISVVKDSNIYNIKAKLDDKEYEFKYDEKAEELTCDLKDENDSSIKIAIKDNVTITYSSKMGQIIIKGESNVENKELDSKFNINAKISEENQKLEFNADISTNIKETDDINVFDSSKAKDFNSVTQEELANIINKFSETIKDTFIEDIISSLSY